MYLKGKYHFLKGKIMKTSLGTFMLIFSISTLFCQTNNLTIKKSGDANQQIILISGLACKNEIWHKTVDSLSADATVYSVDYYNDFNHQLTTIDTITNQILNWIEKQKISNPIIVGHSLGGVLALNVASKLNGNIEKLVIIDSYPALAALSNPNFTPNTNNNCLPLVKQFSAMTPEQFKNFQLGNYRQMTLNDIERTKLIEWVIAYNRNNYSMLLCDYLNTDLRTSLNAINCPTLILGSKTMTALKDHISKQYKSLKAHKLIFSKKGLHFLMIDDFDWYIEKIKDFIKQ
jgi:pimeloyl-ACP methyl ester carboxylesterase